MTIILLVEDDDLKARLVDKMVHKAGMVTIRAQNLEEALFLLRDPHTRGQVGAIITDWVFPMEVPSGSTMPHAAAGRYVIDEAKLHGIPTVVVSGEETRGALDVPWFRTDELRTDQFRSWLADMARVSPGLVAG